MTLVSLILRQCKVLIAIHFDKHFPGAEFVPANSIEVIDNALWESTEERVPIIKQEIHIPNDDRRKMDGKSRCVPVNSPAVD